MPEYFNPFSTNYLTHFSNFNKNEFKYKTHLFEKKTFKLNLDMLNHLILFNSIALRNKFFANKFVHGYSYTRLKCTHQKYIIKWLLHTLSLNMAEAPQTFEQKFTNKLLEILASSKKSVIIWTRVKYEEILEKIKSGKKENCQDYYCMQR